MFTIVLFGLLAAATAAPHFPHHGHLHSPFHGQNYHDSDYDFHPSFGEETFDTARFWQDLESQLQEMDRMIENFRVHFPTTLSTAGVVGNEYRITIPLAGYEEKDIVVKAREGMLMVQAVHKVSDSAQSHYTDIRTLPSTVDVSGVWTYEKDVLTIVFPLKTSASTEATIDIRSEDDDDEPVNKGSETREEIEHNNKNDSQDADVGVHENASKEISIITNEIKPKVEATTYAVDLKNDVEFVPVTY